MNDIAFSAARFNRGNELGHRYDIPREKYIQWVEGYIKNKIIL